ncbi:MAG: cell division topological specificity factor MinE [Proteobacteria bacterium]|nr:cell division topological specificity factor MinE [Pseudomonadota bacterium]MCP4921868.1 cell division topological specificity factor MinE [Pseudomonadota bacterium]
MFEFVKDFLNNKGSKDDAKARLKLLLVHDAVDLTPAQLEAMKAEVVEVIGKYVDIDRDAVDFKLERAEGAVALVSNVPVRRVTARAV